METDTRRQFKSRMDAKQDVWRAVPALMGNGSGVVEVPNQPGYVYIRTSANDLGQAFNNRCPLYDNLAIYCGYDPITDPDRRIFQVLSVRMTDYANAGNTPILNIPNHHLYHEFGGGDDVYVDWRRLLGFRVGRPAAFVVTIDPGVMMRAGAWLAIAAQTVNLVASKPGGVNSARYVLIALDNTGIITTSNGAIVSAPLLDISDCPVPAAGEIPLAAVRLYTSQTQINDTPGSPDIVDLRFPTTYTTGGSNVYGAGTANQFAYWSAADTLASSAEVIRQTNTCLVATKSVAALAPATYYTGLYSNATVTAAVAQAGHLLPVVSHLTAAGAADYTGDLVGYNGVSTLSGTGTSDDVRGYDYTIQLTAAATATEAALFYGYLNAGATGIVTTGYGLRLPAPAGSIGTFYGVHVATLAAATNKWAFYSVGDKITTKQAAAAGIELDVNAATGNFTLSLSPGNLTGNHRVSFGDVTGTAALGAGTLTSATANDVTIANHTHAITASTALVGNGAAQYQVLTTGANPYPAAWSGFLLDGTTGGKTNFAVTNTKTLTLTATDNYNLTIPATGTAALGTGTQFQLAVWSGTNTITGLGAVGLFEHILQAQGAGNNPAWSSGIISFGGAFTELNLPNAATTITGGGVLGLGGFQLTVPATGTAALLGEANVFTANQTISSAAPSLIMTDTTGAAKSLTVAVDANVADLRESAGASGSLLALDLANNRIGVGTAAPGVKLHAYNASGDTYYEMETDSGAAGLILDGSRTTDVYIAIIDFKNSGDDIASIRALRAGANDAASMLFFTQATGGALTNRMTLGSTGGLQMGAPAGGDKGSGTINTAADIYKNNSAYTNPDYALEQWAIGRIKRFADRPGAEGYSRMTLDETERHIKEHLRLPRMSDEPMGIFERADSVLEKLEELYTHVIELHHRIEKLEATNG